MSALDSRSTFRIVVFYLCFIAFCSFACLHVIINRAVLLALSHALHSGCCCCIIGQKFSVNCCSVWLVHFAAVAAFMVSCCLLSVNFNHHTTQSKHLTKGLQEKIIKSGTFTETFINATCLYKQKKLHEIGFQNS